MTHTVVGLFSNRSDAQTAMQELIQAGFIKENIDLSNRSAADTETNYADTAYSNTNTADNQGIGDKISNFFSSLFDDETTASTYTNAAYNADAILTVQADSDERARAASEILDRNGAMDIDNDSAQYGDTYGSPNDLSQNYAGTGSATSSSAANRMNTTDTTDYDTTRNEANLRRDTNIDDKAVIPVMEENLEVGKRTVERGGARIRSRVIEKPVEANVRLREEHVVVNRHPVNRAVTDADVNNFQQGDIELTERAEVPVINKQARVVEEIEVGKTVEEHDQTIRDTVRRTDVDVQETNKNVTDEDISHTGTRRANS
jgi:uncharacterized protein (TIGR02271 family)